MGWLIDTSLWIAVERGAIGAADIHAVTKQEPVYLSPINIAEIRVGLDPLPAGPRKQRAAAAFRRLRRKPQLRITVETAATFGALAATIRKAGLSRDPPVLARAAVDTRIFARLAGTAVASGGAPHAARGRRHCYMSPMRMSRRSAVDRQRTCASRR